MDVVSRKRRLFIGSGIALLISGSIGYVYPLFHDFDAAYWGPSYGYLMIFAFAIQLLLKKPKALVRIGLLLLIVAESTNLYWLYSQHLSFDQYFITSIVLDLFVASGVALFFKSRTELRLLGAILFLAGNLSWLAFSQLGDILKPQLSYAAIALGAGLVVDGLLQNKSSLTEPKNPEIDAQTSEDASKQNSSLLGTTRASLLSGIITLLLTGLLFTPASPFTLTNFLFLVPGSALITSILGIVALVRASRMQSRGDKRLSLASLLMGVLAVCVYIVIWALLSAACSNGC